MFESDERDRTVQIYWPDEAVEAPPLAPGGTAELSEHPHAPADVLMELMLRVLGLRGRASWSEGDRRLLASFRTWVAGWPFRVARRV